MNDYEKDALVIKKMIGVVHPDYLVNSIAVFLKERDTKQLHKPDVMESVLPTENEIAAEAVNKTWHITKLDVWTRETMQQYFKDGARWAITKLSGKTAP